jgi:drug/metabolite transporter (DMT)-like permease
MPPDSKPRLSGVALNLVASAFFSVMSALVKGTRGRIPFAEVVFFRAFFALPWMFLLLRWQRVSLRPKNVRLLFVRGILGSIAMLLYFFALQRGLLADVAVIGRLQPVFVALLSPLLIGERPPSAAWWVLGASFFGVLLVMQPGWLIGGHVALNAPAYAAAAAAALSAVAHVSVRKLNATDHPLMIVTFFTSITGVIGGAMSAPAFVWPRGIEWLQLLGISAFAMIAQVLMTIAYGRERAAVVAAAAYMHIVYALLLGWLIWAELPAWPALLGGLLITACGLWLAYSRRAVFERPS